MLVNIDGKNEKNTFKAIHTHLLWPRWTEVSFGSIKRSDGVVWRRFLRSDNLSNDFAWITDSGSDSFSSPLTIWLGPNYWYSVISCQRSIAARFHLAFTSSSPSPDCAIIPVAAPSFVSFRWFAESRCGLPVFAHVVPQALIWAGAWGGGYLGSHKIGVGCVGTERK